MVLTVMVVKISTMIKQNKNTQNDYEITMTKYPKVACVNSR